MDSEWFFKKSALAVRGNEFTLEKLKARLNVRKYFGNIVLGQ